MLNGIPLVLSPENPWELKLEAQQKTGLIIENLNESIQIN